MLKGNLKKGVWASSKVSLKSKYRNYVIIIISIEYYKLKNKEKNKLCQSCVYSNEWITDSSCSFHICPNKDWLSIYKAIISGIVLMGNIAACKVVGIGIIRFKMHDEIIITLTNVNHAFDLKKNLIPIGTPDVSWCKYIIEGEVMKVSKGAFIVMKA